MYYQLIVVTQGWSRSFMISHHYHKKAVATLLRYCHKLISLQFCFPNKTSINLKYVHNRTEISTNPYQSLPTFFVFCTATNGLTWNIFTNMQLLLWCTRLSPTPPPCMNNIHCDQVVIGLPHRSLEMYILMFILIISELKVTKIVVPSWSIIRYINWACS